MYRIIAAKNNHWRNKQRRIQLIYKNNIFREVSNISKLNHQSILKFIIFGSINFEKKMKPVIVTEYASNRSLIYLIGHDRRFQ